MGAAADAAVAARSIAQNCKRVVIASKTLAFARQMSRNKVKPALMAHRHASTF
jgi:hypothetical protein